jgi:Tfp pilus assembly protein PilF
MLAAKVVFSGRVVCSFGAIVALLVFAAAAAAQGINYTGNGGKHTIQGRIYDPSGQRADLSNLKIVLESAGTGDLSVYASMNGTFTFKNLLPGSYSVSIEPMENFEAVRESVFIDDPGASNMPGGVRLMSTPKIINVQVYLQPKRVAYRGPKPGILNARLSPNSDAVEHYKKAQALNGEGRISAAINELELAVTVDKKFTLAYNDLGLLYTKLPDIDKAIAAFTNAVAADPEDFESNLNFGVANYYKHKNSDAEKALRKAASLDTSAVTPHYYLGLLFIQKKELETAQTEMETARTLTGEKPFPLVHRYLGGIYMAKRMNKEAASELEKYLSLAPNAQDASRIRQTIDDLKKTDN